MSSNGTNVHLSTTAQHLTYTIHSNKECYIDLSHEIISNSRSNGDALYVPYIDREFLTTSPSGSDPNPVKLAVVHSKEETVIHLTFPRRAGLSLPSYGYETSENLTTWEPAKGVTETALSTETVNGVEMENIDAAISTSHGAGFVRMRLPQP
jgi:hypothetical protein